MSQAASHESSHGATHGEADIYDLVMQRQAQRAAERQFTWWERIYLPEVFKGLANTFRHIFIKPFTIKYIGPKTPPQDRHEFVNGYRGEHYLKRHENGMEKCVACYMCATACPADCIEIDAQEAPADEFGDERFKRPMVFNIDMLKCIYCGYCVEACPKDAIGMTTIYNQVGTSRADFIFDKARLLRNNDEYMDKNGLTPSGRAHDGSYPFSPDGCGPEVTHGMGDYRTAMRLHELSSETEYRNKHAKAAAR